MRSLLLILLLWFTNPAWAQAGFQRSQTSTGLCTFWNSRVLTFYVDAAGNPETTGDSEFTAIESALTAWRSAISGCSDATFVSGGTIANPRVEYVPGGNNRNVIVFRQTACSSVVPQGDPCRLDDTCGNAYRCWNHSSTAIAVPTITRNELTGEILDVDIEFNVPSFIFTTVDSPACQAANFNQTCVASDVQNTITPMIGRAIGLDFISSTTSTMSRSVTVGQISKRVIDPDTVTGSCSIYPRMRPPTTCDGGSVVLDAGASPDAGMDAGSSGGGGGSSSGGGGGSSSGGGSGAPPACNALTCAGCCSFDGRCEVGSNDVACGLGGLACASCNGSDSCQMGTCQPEKRGCGCTSAEGGLAMVGLFLAVFRGATRRHRRER